MVTVLSPMAFDCWMTVTSRGQHETGALEAGFLSFGGSEEMSPVWWQLGTSSSSAGTLCWVAFFWLAEESAILGELAGADCVQPTTQTRSAIQNATATAST